MIRIVGILCGSAMAIAFLIIALGIPELLPASEPDDVPPEWVALDSPSDESPPPETEMPVAEPEAPIEPIPEPADETFAETVARVAPIPEPLAENWFAFWSPFHSEIAANGFIAQLQRETGMDYRVVKIKPGVYEVAFAYEGEGDIATKLALISRATGLEMPDG